MTDVCVISVREDARIRDSDWDEVSWPINVSADCASPVMERCRWEEFSKFQRTFTVIVVMPMSVIANFSLASPRAFRVTGESMNEHNAFNSQYEMEA